jgi:hypothetical protein
VAGDGYRYVRKRGDEWVVVQKGSGRVLSRHKTRAQAEASFRAMMASKHGATMRNR